MIDPITKQVEWIKARNLGGNDQLLKTIKYVESLEAENAQLKSELAQAKEAIAYIGSGDATSLTEAEAVARHTLTKLKEGA